ncbi:MAG: MATE family efflux transporter [Oscillospiraceae bacterium]|nr:MATE family efflux transporter [Oscillospiraceae bacterium]
MFFNKNQLRALLVPLVIEQVLTGLMGVADTLMVSNVGEAAISGVALVDAINLLFTYFFSALAAGGTIICSQYFGRDDRDDTNKAAHQLMLAGFSFALVLALLSMGIRRPLLRLIFGNVEAPVMDAAAVYFLITAASYPFLALYTASVALFRAIGDSRRPMLVAAGADLLNIAGNALLIFGLHMGVAGAALATLASRIVSAAVMLYLQSKPSPICLRDIRRLRPDLAMIRRILRVGLPNAVENGMFQFGRLVVQSSVSTLGTTAIAVQAIVLTLETFSSMPAMAVGTGLLTVSGQCIGRGLPDQARTYSLQFTRISRWTLLATGVLLCSLAPLIMRMTALSPEGRLLACRILWVVLAIKLFLWPRAFTLPNGMRAAGDVSYAMYVSTVSMWVFRVALSWYLCRYTPVGLWGAWAGWCTDWLVRNLCFRIRFRSGKWLDHSVLD